MGLRERLARGFSALLRGPDTDGFIFDQENLTACRDQFRALSVSERGLIFLNSNRGTLHLLRRGDPVIRKVAILSAHCGWASWLAPDSGIIVALDDRGARLIVDLSGSSGLCGLVRDFGNSISGVVGISFTPDGQSLAISHFREHFGFYLDLISPHNGQIIETIHKDTCSGIFQFSLDGTRLFRECRDRRIAIHDAGSFRQISLSPPLPGSPLSLVQLPGTSTLIAAGCFSAPALIRLPERDRLLSASPPSTKLKPDPELFTIKGRDMNAPPSAQIQIRDPWTREIHLELPETAAALLAALKPPLEHSIDSPFTVKWNQKARSPGRHVNQLLCYRQGDIFSTGQGEQKEALMIDLISCPGLARFLVRSPLTVK